MFPKKAVVDLSGRSRRQAPSQRNTVAERTAAAREERHNQKAKETIALFVQSHWRSRAVRKKQQEIVKCQWDCVHTFSKEPLEKLQNCIREFLFFYYPTPNDGFKENQKNEYNENYLISLVSVLTMSAIRPVSSGKNFFSLAVTGDPFLWKDQISKVLHHCHMALRCSNMDDRHFVLLGTFIAFCTSKSNYERMGLTLKTESGEAMEQHFISYLIDTGLFKSLRSLVTKNNHDPVRDNENNTPRDKVIGISISLWINCLNSTLTRGGRDQLLAEVVSIVGFSWPSRLKSEAGVLRSLHTVFSSLQSTSKFRALLSVMCQDTVDVHSLLSNIFAVLIAALNNNSVTRANLAFYFSILHNTCLKFFASSNCVRSVPFEFGKAHLSLFSAQRPSPCTQELLEVLSHPSISKIVEESLTELATDENTTWESQNSKKAGAEENFSHPTCFFGSVCGMVEILYYYYHDPQILNALRPFYDYLWALIVTFILPFPPVFSSTPSASSSILSIFSMLTMNALSEMDDAMLYNDQSSTTKWCGEKPAAFLDTVVRQLQTYLLSFFLHYPRGFPIEATKSPTFLCISELLSEIYRRDCRRSREGGGEGEMGSVLERWSNYGALGLTIEDFEFVCENPKDPEKRNRWGYNGLGYSRLLPPSSFETNESHFSMELEEDEEEEEKARRIAGSPVSSLSGSGGIWMAPSGSSVLSVAEIVFYYLPFLIPTPDKVSLLHRWINNDRVRYDRVDPELASTVSVRRSNLVEDSFSRLFHMKDRLKENIKIEFVNDEGLLEAGFGSGLLKEFLSSLIPLAFAPHYGLFCATSQQTLLPNRNCKYLQDNIEKKFEFLGIITGKLIYEFIVAELPLSDFFIDQILGKLACMSDMALYDHQMYSSIIGICSLNEKEISELELTFSHEEKNPITAEIEQTDLVPGGSNISVTSKNVRAYGLALTNYFVNASTQHCANAFRNGLSRIIPIEWIQHFNAPEFAFLLSGTRGPLDLHQLQENTNYSNGYYRDHTVILIFWEVVSRFSPADQALLLKFVTACSRPPLLGFSALKPKFCIHQTEEGRLPTSATCVNQLKLPPIYDFDLMNEKLLYVIRSNSGFELS